MPSKGTYLIYWHLDQIIRQKAAAKSTACRDYKTTAAEDNSALENSDLTPVPKVIIYHRK